MGWGSFKQMSGWRGLELGQFHQQISTLVRGLNTTTAFFTEKVKRDLAKKIHSSVRELRTLWGGDPPPNARVGIVLSIVFTDPQGHQRPFVAHVRSSQRGITGSMSVDDIIFAAIEAFESKVHRTVEKANQTQSGWVVGNVNRVSLEFSRWTFFGAWRPTPSLLTSAHGVINRKPRLDRLTKEQAEQRLASYTRCFRDAVEAALAAQMLPGKASGHNLAAYRSCGNVLNWRGVRYSPAYDIDVERLERKNDCLAIDVFAWAPSNGKPFVTPYRLTKKRNVQYHIQLMLLMPEPDPEGKFGVRGGLRPGHFIAMTEGSLAAILYKRHGGRGHGGSGIPCPRCGVWMSGNSDRINPDGSCKRVTAKERMAEHLKLCEGVNGGQPQTIRVPKVGMKSMPNRLREDRLCFKTDGHQSEHAYAIVWDCETFHKPVAGAGGGPSRSWSRVAAKHEVNSIGAVLLKHNETYREFLHVGSDAVSMFILWLQEMEELCTSEIENRQKDVYAAMTQEDWDAYHASEVCGICGEPFEAGEARVAHHDHLKNKFVCAAHSRCNSAGARVQTILTVTAHAAQKFDTHVLMNAIAEEPGLIAGRKLSCVARNPTQYISWSLDRRRGRKTMTMAADLERRGRFKYTHCAQEHPLNGWTFSDLYHVDPEAEPGVPISDHVMLTARARKGKLSRYLKDMDAVGSKKLDPTKKITRTVPIGLKLVFLDSFNFLNSSLDTLVRNLIPVKGHDDDPEAFAAAVLADVDRIRTLLPNLSAAYKDNNAQFADLCTKGVYPYSWVNRYEQMDATELPPKEAFYSDLSSEHISDAQYARARKVFSQYCTTFEDYHKLYLRCDCLLLADVWAWFRGYMQAQLGLAPEAHLTCSQMFFAAFLRKTKVVVHLLTDSDKIMFSESGIRGGISQNQGYEKGNFIGCPGYDPNAPIKVIMYEDASALYNKAQSHALPLGDFKWIEAEAAKGRFERTQRRLQRSKLSAAEYFDCQRSGCTYMVDLDMCCGGCKAAGHRTNGSVSRGCRGCRALEMKLADYPLAPVVRKVDESELSEATKGHAARAGINAAAQGEKMILDFAPKKRYVIHERLLHLYVEMGMTVTKFHRSIAYTQSRFLKDWVDYCAEMRRLATTDAEKVFWKLAANATYGKNLECVRNRTAVHLIHTADPNAGRRLQKLYNSPYYDGSKQFGDHLIAVTMKKPVVFLNKSIQVGQAILDISKAVMLEKWRGLKQDYGGRVRMVGTDTDSLIYTLTGPPQDELTKRILGSATSHATDNFPDGHALPHRNKGIPGTMKSEEPPTMSETEVAAVMHNAGCDRAGAIEILRWLPSRIVEYVGLGPKSYCYRTLGDQDEGMACKGIKTSIQKHALSFADYKQVAMGGNPEYRSGHFIRSCGHELQVEELSKRALALFSDRRYNLKGSFLTPPYGHHDTLHASPGAHTLLIDEIRTKLFRAEAAGPGDG